ncbi:single-stranded-DNA-specific exonuclease RecJ [Tardibacter chloracetimidivorans]|uniref:Single-stranded-DNA-specific exonuclease RecJ n=1 Tax=Tardibacter chloracetimidivorans TaxID=1921510 RepID=A0A1L3ZQR6_9SPHN|nr:single-stranded-DNA-specific exonuclease RecJ [Tardibacter chloracetimidivorans]API57969.1 single-stranded-DNA-specific exonuclease RecJ [Tardibacter chloracetimidivorans]
MSASSHVFGVKQSILGQPWRWRGGAADGLELTGIETQLYLSRGCPNDDLERHRTPTIRAWMPDPSIFQDMDTAARRIAAAIEAGERIVVFGDYDVDGATSAALLIRLLRAAGAEAGYYIPDRLMEGYGPSAEALVRLGREGAGLIVTVDCGAQAFEALSAARDSGVEVIVVDHHQCSTALPPAVAIVNPNRLDETDGAAHGHLAAVGVAFLLAAAVVRELRSRGRFRTMAEPNLLEWLDIVALGTVADVVALKGLNRAFVAQGLKVMANRRNVGLAALMDAARLTKPPSATDLGFALGPRINAGGRVGKSDLGVRLLTTQDPEEAAAIAEELNRLNEERRALEALVLEQAEAAAVRTGNASVAVVSGAGWHPGVIGIVAGRLKERLNKPAIVIGLDEAGVGKGSGRSISGVDLGAAVIAARESGLLSAGGGHAMAAGLTVEEGRIAELSGFLEDRLAAAVARAREAAALMLDCAVAPRGVSIDLAETLEGAGPYGSGWPSPRVAAGPFGVVSCDVVGQGHVRAILAGQDGGRLKAMAFRHGETQLGAALLAARGRKLYVAGRVKRDDWGTRPQAEMHLDDAAWAD